MHHVRNRITAGALCLVLLGSVLQPAAARAEDKTATGAAVIAHYVDLASAAYGDALASAEALAVAVDHLVRQPTEANLLAARKAWIDARPAYMRTEVFRFGNPEIDDIEGEVNSWPLDEGLIDYVDASYGTESDSNPFYTLNVIGSRELQLGADRVDAGTITPALLRSLQGAGGNEANVAIGYHAVEFLLWGQDLGGAGPGAGNRPASDYDVSACTHGNCDRRADYLRAATSLLVEDLRAMRDVWLADGSARKRLLSGSVNDGLAVILTGLGSLSYGELAGERTKLGLMLHDPEEEQDCFSDNTHNSHYYDQAGIAELYNGTHVRPDGSTLDGPALRDLVAATDPAANDRMIAALAATGSAVQVLKDTVDGGRFAYDQLIAEGNPEGNRIVSGLVDRLVDQAHAIEAVVSALGLEIAVQGSDSLDSPAALGQ